MASQRRRIAADASNVSMPISLGPDESEHGRVRHRARKPCLLDLPPCMPASIAAWPHRVSFASRLRKSSFSQFESNLYLIKKPMFANVFLNFFQKKPATVVDLSPENLGIGMYVANDLSTIASDNAFPHAADIMRPVRGGLPAAGIVDPLRFFGRRIGSWRGVTLVRKLLDLETREQSGASVPWTASPA